MQKNEMINNKVALNDKNIQILMLSGEFYYPYYRNVSNFSEIAEKVKTGQKKLRLIKKSDVIDLFNQYSKNLLHSPDASGIEGIAFLSNWLRKSNFLKIIDKNFKSIEYLEKFVGEKKRIKAQPRGIVCHWIAGNVPTLGLFSLFQSLFVGNANIVRIPVVSHDIMSKLLKILAETHLENGISGLDLLESISLIYFDHKIPNLNAQFSNIADVRVVWGGKSAVEAITGLPSRIHCEDLVFGPKYSFAVFDQNAQLSTNFKREIKNLIGDVFLFDQAACTSPHTIFFEKNGLSLDEILGELKKGFQVRAKNFPKLVYDSFILSKIINVRAEYALDLEKKVICPKENDWTILVNDNLCLEEPIESRTVFIKMVDNIMDIVPLITRKVQTIGCAIYDKTKLSTFADEVTFKGVSRCVKLGQMHLFDTPWDGMLFMSRLVNWVTLYYGNEK
ncbi:MAG: acyl-CoA reductase [Promethearchaeota archaeon]